MRLCRILYLASAGAVMLSPRAAHAQATREVVFRLHRAGDTVSIQGAAVTIDHTIEAGKTDAAGIVRVPDLLDGGHIIDVVARGYQAYFDNFVSGVNVRQPIQLELLPVPASDTAKAKGQNTDLKFVGFDARRARARGRFFTRAQLDKSAGASPPDLDKIFAEQLGGIELYVRAASVPVVLRDAASCGALVLWTR